MAWKITLKDCCIQLDIAYPSRKYGEAGGFLWIPDHTDLLNDILSHKKKYIETIVTTHLKVESTCVANDSHFSLWCIEDELE